MRLLKQNGPFCLVYSTAMVLDEDPEVLHKEIGTNGTEIWWGDCYMRGIHIQEIQDCCTRRGKCLYNIELYPYLCPTEDHSPKLCYPQHMCVNRFRESLTRTRAILITENHAVAWDGTMVYDPKGFIKSFDEYLFKEAWLLTDLISQF